MFISRLVPPLRLLCRSSGGGRQPSLLQVLSGSAPLTCCSFLNTRHGTSCYSTVADNAPPPRWVQLEPELDDALVPRKMSMSPLESWLSLRYSLPPYLEAPPQQGEVPGGRGLLEEKVLPPFAVPLLEDPHDGGVVGGVVGEIRSVTPISCKNVLEIRRRKMNRHKYKKLMKRMKFVRRRVLFGRGKKKQKRFEEDLERIWKRAGLKKAPEGYTAPKIFIKGHGNRN